MRFRDRRRAGEVLGEAVAAEAPISPVVYALPRGGVPVGFEVARILHCPLDVLIVRKLGVPSQPELAMGAIAEGGVTVRNETVLELAGVTAAVFDRVLALETSRLEAAVTAYRVDSEPVPPRGHTAIVVDDGLATGSTARAAVAVSREAGAAAIWLAVPVAPADTVARLGGEVDRLVVTHVPRHFEAVGSWYRDFSQTGDEEVRELLARARLA
ncbi:MAG TPA: phosphoribosyltransferase family protein [Acidimicrobiia bacterium]